MQQQVVWSMNRSNDNDTKTDCFSYIVKQYYSYIDNVGALAKKVLSKPWTILSKQSRRKKKKQNCHSSETITKIDVISLFQSNNFRQKSVTVLSKKTSKTQVSRQLLESLVIVTDPIMPLAQNYKDDVSLLESETALSKTTMNCNTNTEFSANQDTITKPNHGSNLGRNGLSTNIIQATTTNTNNNNNDDMLADDDLPENISVKSTASAYDTVK